MSDCQNIMLAGVALVADGSGALWWPEARLLCVADLHFGKSERLARRGGPLLPPYETRETLDRLAAAIRRYAPATVVCLGDSFDDDAAVLDPGDTARLGALTAGQDWVWIAGNHDPRPRALAGSWCDELRRDPLTFRHEARPDAETGEVSGHYHPKIRVALKGARLSRPCFLLDARRLILPAFGAFTGGLDAGAPALRALLRCPAQAILTGSPCVRLPLTGALAGAS